MIVTKEMRLKVLYLQGRRIACTYCRKPFTYLAEGEFTASTTGLPLLSSDDGMRAIVADLAKKRLHEADRKERWGEGFCPRCRRFPLWMARKSRFRRLLKWGAAGSILGFFLSLVSMAPSGVSGWEGALPLLVFLAAVAAGLFVGWMRSLPGGRVPGEDSPLSLTDEELATLFVHARESGEDPVAAWWATVNAAPREGRAFATIGFRDFAGGGALPAEWTSEAVLERL